MLLLSWTSSWMTGSRSNCYHCGHDNGSFKKCYLAIKKAAEGGNAMQKHALGHRWIITPEDDWYVSLMVKRNWNAICCQIAADLAINTILHVSVRTNSLRLNQVCMHGNLFDAFPFIHAIVEKDYVGVRNMLNGVTNSGVKWYSPSSLDSLWQVILSTSYDGER